MTKKLLFILLFLQLTVLVGCRSERTPDVKEDAVVKGNVSYGGVFRVFTPEKIDGIFPLSGTDAFSRDITFQIFEPLLRTDLNTMRTIPHLAKSFVVNDSGTLYTLIIRDDVYFHEDDCFDQERRKLNIEDVKFSLELACSDLPINKMSYLLINKVRGAAAFHKRTKKKLHPSGVKGIQVVNDSTISIQLIEPFSGFEKILAHANLCIYAPEVFSTYGLDMVNHPIGTGPFIMSEKTPEKLILSRFNDYWRKDQWGNKLPYIDGVEMTLSQDKKKELEAFRDAEVDAVLGIPVDQINYVLGTLQEAQKGANVIHKVLSKASMSIMYIGFANESKEFGDVRVRKAFNLAVNKTEVVNSYLGGEGWPASNGFIPPLDFYPNDDVKGTAYNPEMARELLVQAGYASGDKFPHLEIYVNAQENSPQHRMVKGVVDQLKTNLGVELKIKLCNIRERDEAIARGEAKIWRAGWIADYPDPENFLSLFYSRNIGQNNSTINSFRFKNAEFDAMLDQANKERDEKTRNQLFVMCDQVIVNESAVMPVLTEDYIILLNGRVKNFSPNSMEIMDLSTIFIRRIRS
jgi:oligopeptide transport system substrate-binding protein